MKDPVHRNAPVETRSRALVALLTAVPGIPLFLWGLVGLSAVPGRPAVFVLLLVGGLLSAVGLQLLRGILAEAEAAPRDANPVLAAQRRAEVDPAQDDPVAVLQDQFARGELSQEEFDRRMERLLESDRERAEATGEPERA
jgi:putative membrane protein